MVGCVQVLILLVAPCHDGFHRSPSGEQLRLLSAWRRDIRSTIGGLDSRWRHVSLCTSWLVSIRVELSWRYRIITNFAKIFERKTEMQSQLVLLLSGGVVSTEVSSHMNGSHVIGFGGQLGHLKFQWCTVARIRISPGDLQELVQYWLGLAGW